MLENDKENVSVAKIHTLMKTSQVINLNPDFVTIIIWQIFFHIFCWRLFKRISLHCDSKSATGHIKVKRKKEVLMVLITNYCFFATFTPGVPPGPPVSRSREFSTFFFLQKFHSSSHDNNNFLRSRFSITRTSYDLHPCVKFAKLHSYFKFVYWKMTLLLNYCRS